MTRSLRRRLLARRGFPSPLDGGVTRYAAELQELSAQWCIESGRWTGDTADDIWRGMWQLDAVRLDLITGKIKPLDAAEWLTAGRSILDQYQEARSRNRHPAGRRR